VELTRERLGAVQRLSYLASADIAAEKGSFPLYDRARYLAGETVKALPEDVRSAIGRYGIRNSLLNSIAPTGTISLLADNVSSGIEPVFAFSFVRHVLQPDGSKRRTTSTARSPRPSTCRATSPSKPSRASTRRPMRRAARAARPTGQTT
jgi:ribonucleoside-diphosphate reductase alpha chain